MTAHGSLLRRDESEQRSKINVLGKPDPRCKLRHTDFVEMTAPLLSNKVLALILLLGERKGPRIAPFGDGAGRSSTRKGCEADLFWMPRA